MIRQIDVEECAYTIPEEGKFNKYTIITEKGFSYTYADKYKCKLGKGISGDVFEAEFTEETNHQRKSRHKMNTSFALKIIEYVEEEGDHEQIKREIELLQSINNDCIVSLYDWGHTSTHYYLFFERLWQGNLIEYTNYYKTTFNYSIDQAKILPLVEIRIIAVQIAEGLSALHKKGIIHQDIKPANVFMDYSHAHTTSNWDVSLFGVVALLGDLGNAIHFNAESRYANYRIKLEKELQNEQQSADTNESISANFHSMAGTPGYMAPEVVSRKKYSRKADIWSLGSLIHEMYYGKVPNKDENFVRPKSSNSTAAVDELNQLLEEMLIVDPAKRYDIFQVLESNFLNFGYLQLLLWRIELSNIVTFMTTVEHITALAKKCANSLPIIQDEIAVHSICTWAMAFRNSRKTRQYLDEMLLKNWQETLENLTENKFNEQKKMKISSEFKTIIGLIQSNYEKTGILYLRNDKEIPNKQEKLFNLLLESRMKMMKRNSEYDIRGKFLHSILFGRVLEISYSEECFKLLVGGKNGIVYAIDWGNSRIGHENELELAQKRESFLSKYYEELFRSPETTSELHIFFHENQRIPTFLHEQKLELSKSIYSGHSLIRAINGSRKNDSKNSKFEVSIVMLPAEPMMDFLSGNFTDDDNEINDGITFMQFRKFSK